MKKNTIARLLALLLAVAMLAAVGCKTTTPTAEPTAAPEATAEPTAEPVKADVPADRYDATVTPRTGANATNPLVLSTSTLDGKFSPFFYTSAYDNDVQTMTQIGLLFYDKTGAPQAGVEYPCLAYDYTQEVAADQSTSTYTFILKNGLTFSDGVPVTAKDVLFNIYVYCDPLYDALSTFYQLKIQGLDEYRMQTSADAIKVADAIKAAGIKADADGKLAYDAAEGATAEQQAAFWAHLDEAGAQFAQEIITYVMTNYATDEYAARLNSTAADIKASENLTVAFGMNMWGYGALNADGKFVDALGNVYDLATDTLTADIYWQNILQTYGYDLSDAGINLETAGTRVEDFCRSLYLANEGAVEGGVKSISGITSGTMKCDDGVEREYVKVVLNGIDPVAIFQLGIVVAPQHYYTEGFKGELNEFGVAMGNPEFISLMKDKNSAPMGAGPYKFVSYKDNVVTFDANDSFCLGSPKIKTLRFQEITLGAELDALKTGTVHYSDPSASTTIINDVTAGQGDYAKLSYILVDNDGYGYICMNAQAIPEFGARKAIASTMNLELVIQDYYGELASINYRTMSKVCWAYPENPQPLYPYDGTGATAKQLLIDAGYIYDEAANIMYYPATSAKAGQQFTVKATLPSNASDHPAGSVLINSQAVLASIGVKMDIDVDQNVLGKLSTAYESGLEIVAAAWGNGGVDPDMFQVWYSDPAVNQGTSPNTKGLYWLYNNGSDEEKAILMELNELIVAGRSTLDAEERKAIYARALELSTSICCEIPTYQRKNLYVYNKDVIKGDTLFSGDDVTPFQTPTSFIWNVELVG